MADWHLTTRNYNRWAAGAEHWYGTLRRDDDGPEAAIELTRPVTRADLRPRRGFESYHEGEPTNRFAAREEVFGAAQAEFLARAEPGDVLYLGSPVLPDRRQLASYYEEASDG